MTKQKKSWTKSSLLTSELLILPDGRILVHNLTQPFAELLLGLNPDDEQIASRQCRTKSAPVPIEKT